MMDFARKQLEKYGWTDGKGLGKHENGISEALKPKLKRSAAGIGHDPASEFNEHWWSALYDKAAANVEVKEKNGKTKRIKVKEDFQITNSTWKLKQKPKENTNEEQYSDFFVRTAVLTNGGSKVEKIREMDSDNEDNEKRDVFKMTDEELFKACEGRTAHKGARHGLKATGKLARIAQQEALLLKESRFNGYSHAKKLKESIVEEMNLNSDTEIVEKKKKKKRKRCSSYEKGPEYIKNITQESMEIELTEDDNVASVINEENISRKSKKSKRKHCRAEVASEGEEIVNTLKKNKKQKETYMECIDVATDIVDSRKKKSKKKKKDVDMLIQ